MIFSKPSWNIWIVFCCLHLLFRLVAGFKSFLLLFNTNTSSSSTQRSFIIVLLKYFSSLPLFHPYNPLSFLLDIFSFFSIHIVIGLLPVSFSFQDSALFFATPSSITTTSQIEAVPWENDILHNPYANHGIARASTIPLSPTRPFVKFNHQISSTLTLIILLCEFFLLVSILLFGRLYQRERLRSTSTQATVNDSKMSISISLTENIETEIACYMVSVAAAAGGILSLWYSLYLEERAFNDTKTRYQQHSPYWFFFLPYFLLQMCRTLVSMYHLKVAINRRKLNRKKMKDSVILSLQEDAAASNFSNIGLRQRRVATNRKS